MNIVPVGDLFDFMLADYEDTGNDIAYTAEEISDSCVCSTTEIEQLARDIESEHHEHMLRTVHQLEPEITHVNEESDDDGATKRGTEAIITKPTH